MAAEQTNGPVKGFALSFRFTIIPIETVEMPMSELKKRKPALPLGLSELDRVILKNQVLDKGQNLPPGLVGTIVLCHGSEAYEVEFDAIDDDFFQIPAKDLEKAQ